MPALLVPRRLTVNALNTLVWGVSDRSFSQSRWDEEKVSEAEDQEQYAACTRTACPIAVFGLRLRHGCQQSCRLSPSVHGLCPSEEEEIGESPTSSRLHDEPASTGFGDRARESASIARLCFQSADTERSMTC